MSDARELLASAYRLPGPWTSVYVDVSNDVGNPRGTISSRQHHVYDVLKKEGAPPQDVEAVKGAIEELVDVPSPASKVILVRDGTVWLSEVVSGAPARGERISYGPLPDSIPYLNHHPLDFAAMTVVVGRGGGEIRLYRLGEHGAESERIQGRQDSLNKVRAGGWSNSRYQHHTEDVWMHNEDEIAARVNELVLEHRPRVLVAAGDVRALQLLKEKLSAASTEVLSVLQSDVEPPGAPQDALMKRLDEQIDQVLANDENDALARLRSRTAGEFPSEALGIGEVTQALQQAQVDLLLIDADSDRTLLALDGQPWVATAPEQALGAGVVAEVPAADALVRSAVMTDARVIFVTDGELPEGQPVAALLRWPVGP